MTNNFRRHIFSLAALIATLGLAPLSAEGIKGSIGDAHARLGQDDAVRRRGAVEAVGRWVVDHYADKQSATYGILDVTKPPYSADST